MSDVEIRVLATKIRDFLDEYWLAGDLQDLLQRYVLGTQHWR